MLRADQPLICYNNQLLAWADAPSGAEQKLQIVCPLSEAPEQSRRLLAVGGCATFWQCGVFFWHFRQARIAGDRLGYRAAIEYQFRLQLRSGSLPGRGYQSRPLQRCRILSPRRGTSERSPRVRRRLPDFGVAASNSANHSSIGRLRSAYFNGLPTRSRHTPPRPDCTGRRTWLRSSG